MLRSIALAKFPCLLKQVEVLWRNTLKWIREISPKYFLADELERLRYVAKSEYFRKYEFKTQQKVFQNLCSNVSNLRHAECHPHRSVETTHSSLQVVSELLLLLHLPLLFLTLWSVKVNLWLLLLLKGGVHHSATER